MNGRDESHPCRPPLSDRRCLGTGLKFKSLGVFSGETYKILYPSPVSRVQVSFSQPTGIPPLTSSDLGGLCRFGKTRTCLQTKGVDPPE